MRAAVVLAAVLLLAGCGGARLTVAQAEQGAQAKANAQAAALCTDAPARAVLLEAVAARMSAMLADVELPAPATPVAALVEPSGAPILPAVEREREASQAAAEAPPAGFLGAILAGAGGVGLLALSVLRFSPGAFGLVANLAHGILAPRATRDMRAAQAKASEVAEVAVAYGHTLAATAKAAGLGAEVERINERAAAAQDALGLREQVAAILAAVKARAGPPPVPSPPPSDRVSV